MLLTIVVINKEKMSNILKELVSTKVPLKTSSKEKILNYLIALVIIVFIFIGDQLIVNLIGYGKG